jgi:DNA-binding transcriptional MerR regulator
MGPDGANTQGDGVNSKELGQMKATLEVQEQTAEQMRNTADALSEKLKTINRAMTLIDDLSDRIEQVEALIKKYARSEWMTTTELAAELRIDEQSVRYWYHAGLIPGHRIGEKGMLRFDMQEVREVLKQ